MNEAATIHEFDRPTCRWVVARVLELLQPLREEMGVEVTTKPGRYSSMSFTLPVVVSTVSDGVANTPEREAFAELAVVYDLSPLDLDREFSDYSGNRFRVVGLKPKARKYPIICERVADGHRFKFPVQQVKDRLAAEDG